ncbi:MAG: O-antigen ligase family protein, partial [Candidatus Moraniibacteriota bacterium]
VMPGRPNGSFAEPDWLGFFSVLILIFVFTALYRLLKSTERDVVIPPLQIFWQIFLLIPVFTALILTASRSAWLAAFVGLIVWTSVAIFSEGKNSLRRILQSVQILVITAVVALVIVIDVPLTRFDLLNRAESTATGFQEITVACETFTNLPEVINSIDDLRAFSCRHIDLEERALLTAAGFSIQTVQRPDPNIAIRSEIYRQTWSEIRAHPVLGIGWGNIGVILGRDENGAAYNASNIWLEVLLGAGLLGLLGLAGVFGEIIVQAGRECFSRKSGQTQSQLALVLAVLSAFFVFNLFNAGLLIGFVWIAFSAVPAILLKHETKELL